MSQRRRARKLAPVMHALQPAVTILPYSVEDARAAAALRAALQKRGRPMNPPMATVSVTSKGQVTIPKRVRQALGITPGSKVEFDLDRGGARLKLVKKQAPSRIEDGPGILSYTGPRIPIARMHGGVAMTKAARRARR